MAITRLAASLLRLPSLLSELLGGDPVNLDYYIDKYPSLKSFYRSSDNGDYGPAMTRAASYSAQYRVPIRLDTMYIIKSRPDLASGCEFVGLGKYTGLACQEGVYFTMLYASGKNNLRFSNFRLYGGQLDGDPNKNYTRGARFINCSDIEFSNMWTSHFPDWGISFEACDYIEVKYVNHRGGGLGRPGGRDGIHFLNCNNVDVHDCDIISGDDCVAFTTESGKSSNNVSIRNIKGTSEIGSVVTVGFESDLSGTIDNLFIDNIVPHSAGGCRYIVQCRGVAAGSIASATINNIRGTSRLYGMFLQYIDRLTLTNINVISQTQHGLHATSIGRLFGSNVSAVSQTDTWDGIHIEGVTESIVLSAPYVRSSNNYGIHILSSGLVTITEASTKGTVGGARIVNCGVVIVGGSYITDTGSYGITSTGNTTTRLRTGIVARGVTRGTNLTNRSGVSDEAVAYGDVSQIGATTLSSASVYTTTSITLTPTAVGTISAVFTEPQRANRYVVNISSWGTTVRRVWVSAKSETGFTISSDDFAGAPANASFTFEVLASGSAYV